MNTASAAPAGRSFVSRLRNVVRNQGSIARALSHIASTAWQRILRAIHYTEGAVLLQVDLRGPDKQPDDGTVRLEPLTEQNLAEMRSFIRTHNVQADAALKRLDDCLKRGYQGLIGRLADGQMMGLVFYSVASNPHPQEILMDIPRSADSAFAFDWFIGPPFRGANGGLKFVHAFKAYLSRIGFAYIRSYVRADNRRSVIVQMRAGFRQIGERTVHVWFNNTVSCGNRWIWFDRTWV